MLKLQDLALVGRIILPTSKQTRVKGGLDGDVVIEDLDIAWLLRVSLQMYKIPDTARKWIVANRGFLKVQQ